MGKLQSSDSNCFIFFITLARHYKQFRCPLSSMAENIYDEIEIEDMTYDPTLQIYHYPCPCGDRFEIGIADLREKEDIAVCPSCSLMIRVIFEVVCLRVKSPVLQ